MNIYIHVPFCATRCAYCDFFSQTNLSLADAYTDAVCHELELRYEEYACDLPFAHIYLGGGTPSQLSPHQLTRIFQAIGRYGMATGAEITLEMNPDDVTDEYLRAIRPLPINRISMGVQSFSDSDLLFLNRRHTAREACDAVACLRKYGYTEISIDLIYGLPGQSVEAWDDNLSEALRLEVPHLSAYHLIYEAGTPLTRRLERGEIQEVSEDVSVQMFEHLIDRLTIAGYAHYEISNFALPGHEAQLNSGYWNDAPYIGLGPAAHSYRTPVRSYNPAHLKRYLKAITENKIIQEKETLTEAERYDEYIMTRLRTRNGLNADEVEQLFGSSYRKHLLAAAQPYLTSGHLFRSSDGQIRLTRSGIFISDGIISRLFG